MNSSKPNFPFPAKLHLLLLPFLLTQANLAFCGGTVTNPTQASLEAALAGGGTVLFACNGTITLTNTLTIAQNTTLEANGFQMTLSGGNAVRLFQVNTNVSFRVNGLTLANGAFLAPNGTNGTPAGPGQDAAGGCLLNQDGIVTLTGCTLTNHLAQGGNSGGSGAQTGKAFGGALCSYGGQLNLTNCLLAGCTAIGGLGWSSTTASSPSGSGRGGAIFLAGCTLNLQAVTLTNNRALGGDEQAGGSLYVSYAGEALGGAVYAASSSLYATDSILTGNAATGGSSQSFGSAGGSASGGALFLEPGCSAVFSLSSLSGNSASAGQAGPHGTAGSGRGGAVFNAGEFRAYNSTFSTNLTQGASGMNGERLGQGGALYSTQAAVLTACTFDGNTARGGGGYYYYGPIPGGPGEGGAIWSSGLLAATNTTWSANRALGGPYPYYIGWANGPASGGALCVTGGAATLVNVTMAGNCAGQDPGLFVAGLSQGGALMNTNGTVLLRNSILAYGTSIVPNYYGTNVSSGSNVWGTVTDAGYNLSSDTTGGFSAPGSLMNTDPLLDPLADNGGPTATVALQPGSPARDQIPADFPSTDQRGVARPLGTAADMGAFEASFAPTVRVTLQTVPPGLSILVDGTQTVTAPHTFNWLTNSCHTLDASNPGNAGQNATRYFWTSWSDGDDISHQVCPATDTTNTASFRAQYFLSLSAGPDFGGTVSPSNGWYDDGQTVSITAVPQSGFTFNGWTGSGSAGAYTGTNNPAQVTMNGWVTEFASFIYTNPCTFSLSASNATFPATQELGSVLVISPDTNCPWGNFIIPCDWVHVTSGSPSSPLVNYWVEQNSSTNARTCTLLLTGLPFTITQAGRCGYNLSQLSTNIGPEAMAGALEVSTTAACSWAALSGCNWLHATNSGTGPGVINYTVDPNPYTNSRSCVLTVASQSFTVIQAGATPPAFVNGTYHGLFYPADGVSLRDSGWLTVRTTQKKAFSGQVRVEGRTHSFHGSFDSSGRANLMVARPRQASLAITLQLQGENTITGTVGDAQGAWVAPLRADRAVFSAAHPCAYAGLYTFMIAGNTNPAVLPGGDSFGTFKVSARGGVTVAGSLADGTKFTRTTYVAEDGRLPLFASLYRGLGLVICWTQLPADSTNSLSGQGVWLKPAATGYYKSEMNEPIQLFGMKYAVAAHEPVFHFSDGFVAIAGGNLIEPLSIPVQLLSNNSVMLPQASNLQLKLAASSGKFSGSFSVPPSPQTYRFQGILIPQWDRGYGYFLGTNQSGYVRISPEGF